MAIIEGIGDEIILFLAITFIVAVIISIFIFPSQYISQNTLRSNNDVLLLHPSTIFAEQNSTTVNHPVEIRNESINDSNIQYSNQISATLVAEDEPVINGTTDSRQELTSPDHSIAQTETHSINNPEFLRKHRLKFFSERLASQNSERVNNGLANNCDAGGESSVILNSQQNEIAVSSNNTSTVNIAATPSENTIRVRLKYLSDTERLVYSKLDDKIGDFKRMHFLEDITNNKIIRLIYNGQLLHGEDRTLESYGITNNSVIHVQISQNQQPQGPNTADDNDLDLSHLMWPLFGIILGVLWMLHFQYREYFNIASTVALVGITGLFLMAVWSQSSFHRGPTLRTRDNQ